MRENNYNSWPLGPLRKEFQRKELEELKEKGYVFSDPREVIDLFENKIAMFAGCKYAVLVDCCTHGVFLALKYLQEIGELLPSTSLSIPARTYASIPMCIKQAGNNFELTDEEWSGIYQVGNTRVWDSAVRWTKSMYVGGNALQVCSFQLKKRVPIGRGGVIMTNDEEAAKWIKLATYDGRDLTLPYDDPKHFKMHGYHFYMTPEDAARGIMLMDAVPEVNDDSATWKNYPDLRDYPVFNQKATNEQ